MVQPALELPGGLDNNDMLQVAVRVNGEDAWTTKWMTRREALAWILPPESQMVADMVPVLRAFLSGRPLP
jgi:hypothetical protein